jgi:predicted transglutaminase-like cysteine proteinase
MRIQKAAGQILTLALLMTTSASATSNANFVKPAQDAPQATEYGKSLPPVGYVAFCGRGEEECKFNAGKQERLAVSTENWDQIQQVNHYVNTKIRPATDMENYGVADFWTYPIDAGDCEDYALLKKRYLQGMGFNADQLLMTVVLDENSQGHAVLTIPTDKGDFILDNRRAEILRWDQTGYVFLKRQSQQQATQWISLQKQPSQVLVGTKSN